MSKVDFNSNPIMPGTSYGSFANDVYSPKDALTLSLLGRVAPASNSVPLGAIMFDGSINFAIHEQSSNIQLDAKGRIIGISSPSGKITTLSYNNQNELIAVKQSDGQHLKKRHTTWFDEHGAESCWKEIVALQDGTLWCKKADGVIVNNHVDETVTLQNIRQRFILWFDNKQRLTAVRYPNGQSRFFAYGNDGLFTMTEPDGSKFFFQDGEWHNDADFHICVDELKVVNDGTVIYKVGNQIVATSAAGKVKRVVLTEGDAGFQRSNVKLRLNNDIKTTEIKKLGNERNKDSDQNELAEGDADSVCADPVLLRLLEHRNHQQKSLMNCPLDLAAVEMNEGDEYRTCNGRQGEAAMEVLLFRIESGKDLSLSKRLDLAATEVSNYLFGTYPVAVVRMLENNSEIERAIVKELPGSSAQWFERKIWSLMSILKNKDSASELREIINRDEEFRRKLEQAAVERLIIGGCRRNKPEPHFAIAPSASSYQIINDELEGTFDPEATEPHWENVSDGTYKQLFNALSSDWLSVETAARIASFLKCFNSADGKEYLLNFGLYEDEIDSLIARAEWLNKHQKLPNCVT